MMRTSQRYFGLYRRLEEMLDGLIAEYQTRLGAPTSAQINRLAVPLRIKIGRLLGVLSGGAEAAKDIFHHYNLHGHNA